MNTIVQALEILAPEDLSAASEVEIHVLQTADQVLPLNEALRIKAAELWLDAGEGDSALRELEHLSRSAWNHPSAVKARDAALGLLGV